MTIKMKVMEDHLLVNNIATTIEMLKVHNIHLNNIKTLVKKDHILGAMTAMKRKSLGSSSSPCPNSTEKKTPMHTYLGFSRKI